MQRWTPLSPPPRLLSTKRYFKLVQADNCFKVQIHKMNVRIECCQLMSFSL
jgi:hypothetical protein